MLFNADTKEIFKVVCVCFPDGRYYFPHWMIIIDSELIARVHNEFIYLILKRHFPTFCYLRLSRNFLSKWNIGIVAISHNHIITTFNNISTYMFEVNGIILWILCINNKRVCASVCAYIWKRICLVSAKYVHTVEIQYYVSINWLYPVNCIGKKRKTKTKLAYVIPNT